MSLPCASFACLILGSASQSRIVVGKEQQAVAPAYTTYTYDGIGRTLSVVAADGASTTASSFSDVHVLVVQRHSEIRPQVAFVLVDDGRLVDALFPHRPEGVDDFTVT